MTVVNVNKDVATTVKSFPEILKEYYFLDYRHNPVEEFELTDRMKELWEQLPEEDKVIPADNDWIRRPYERGDELAESFEHFDPREDTELRIQSMFDLYQMVNDKGMNKDECETEDIKFVPHCQKAVWMFGEKYEITQEKFQNNAKCSDDYETYQVLPLSKTSFDEEGFEVDPLTKDIQQVAFSTCHFNDFEKNKISDLASEINEIYQSKGGKKVFPFNGIAENFSTICVNLVKRSLQEISESEEGHDKFLKEIADRIDNVFKE